MDWETVIGLEVHAQLATESKLFSGAATRYGAAANTQACGIDLGLPGVLPVINARAVRMAVLFGVAIDAEIATTSVFARKNYFYPDLPKGYQISQFELPIVSNGRLEIPDGDGTQMTVRIRRAHLEEDAGKSLHEDYHGMTGIDLNRAGTPLLEIVSEPDLRGATQAVTYLRALHTLVRYLGICDGNLEEGSFRCDANVSVRRRGTDALGTRTETKNLNSFRYIERAIVFEVARQIAVIENGGAIMQETRLYDPERDETRLMRSKEDAEDYRYFPDPDLPPLHVSADLIADVRASMPELPQTKSQRFAATYELTDSDRFTLTRDRELADYFEQAVAVAGGHAKTLANWLTGDLFAALHRTGRTIRDCPVTPAMLARLVLRIQDGTLSIKLAKQVFEALWQGEPDVDDIIRQRGLQQISANSELEMVVDEVLATHPDQVAQLRAGKDKVIAYFVGQVMQRTRGKANPQQLNQMIRDRLARG